MTETYQIGTRPESERLVREWGFSHVFTWSDGRHVYISNKRIGSNSDSSGAYYPPHTHGGLTTHLIRRGSLTITYPEDNERDGAVKKETFGAGARVDVPAGKMHEVWIGEEGCEYVIGE